MKELTIKSQYYDAIMAGMKTLEVRVGYNNIRAIQAGDRVELKTHNRFCVIKILAVRTYDSFEQMLDKEDPIRVIPGVNKSQALRTLSGIYSKEKEQLGVFVFEIKPE